ncbi:hypothetical protein Back2_21120 [Nocardioides baekrokdamisoli]|uniref:Uncharacterized protein n=1 Tax=Nocardioides baekrokdamisoli TaxID=1804624 RepID=A0A3G9IP38_9ACTN|nr:hypothetical protein Back2_21120 [Nocardioides baekrokdamisoli]
MVVQLPESLGIATPGEFDQGRDPGLVLGVRGSHFEGLVTLSLRA